MSPAKGEKLIEVKGLEKHFKHVEVLRGINIDICKGDVVVIIGPSGGGKSTFIRCLNLLAQTTAGKIYFEGEDITAKGFDVNRHRQKVGMVFQQFNLFNNLTVLENITISLTKVKKQSEEESKEKALKLLKRVGLEDKANAYPSQLSGGQKQRLSIARAIAKHPQIYLFDDSFSALDYKTDVALRRALKAQTDNATVIIVAQRISTVLHANQILVLDEGRLVGKGTHAQLMESCPAYQEIARSQLSQKELNLQKEGE